MLGDSVTSVSKTYEWGNNINIFRCMITELTSIISSLKIFVYDTIQEEGNSPKGKWELQEECRWELWIHWQKDIAQNLGMRKEMNCIFSSIVLNKAKFKNSLVKAKFKNYSKEYLVIHKILLLLIFSYFCHLIFMETFM